MLLAQSRLAGQQSVSSSVVGGPWKVPYTGVLAKSFLAAHRSICTHGFNHRLKNIGEAGEAGDCLEFPWKCLHITTSINLDEQALDYCHDIFF